MSRELAGRFPILPMTSTTQSKALTFLIIAGGSIFYSSKGVFVKMAYQEGVDAISILMLRMGLAFPVFLVISVVSSVKQPSLSAKDWLRLMLLGFSGYYLSSFINFTGLQYISVGLERITLYTYPCMVFLIGVLFYRRVVTARQWLALGLAYIGVVVAFLSEIVGVSSLELSVLGVALVLLSALIYAAFISVTGQLIQRLGTFRFTSIVVGFSCLFMATHYTIVHDWSVLMQASPRVIGLGGVLAIFGTILPSFLMAAGIRRAGPEMFAVVGSIGPIATIFLAYYFLGEVVEVLQAVGFILAIAGAVVMTLAKTA